MHAMRESGNLLGRNRIRVGRTRARRIEDARLSTSVDPLRIGGLTKVAEGAPQIVGRGAVCPVLATDGRTKYFNTVGVDLTVTSRAVVSCQQHNHPTEKLAVGGCFSRRDDHITGVGRRAGGTDSPRIGE